MCEFQVALTLSQIDSPNDDRQIIAALVKAGRFVIVAEFPRYCHLTDALIGSGKMMVSDHATREEALAAMPADEEELYHYVLPKPQANNVKVVNEEKQSSVEDEIPF